MKIKYLGTAAAEGFPSLFCECDVCKKARELGGRNFRSRSQALINDDLLIDYPPDSFYHFNINNVDFGKIHNLIVTHNHEDHYYPKDFEYFLTGFAHPKQCLPFTINGSIDLYNDIKGFISNDRNQGLAFNELKPYETYQIGKYKVTPLRASHGTMNPYIYIVSDNVKTLLYCHDSGLLKDEVYDYLAKNNVKLDLISLDCTCGFSDIKPTGHMIVPANRMVVNKLKELGIIDEKTIVVLNHFSHNGLHNLYDELVDLVKNDGFIVSYDGLEIEF